jgi:hypothetical protein
MADSQSIPQAVQPTSERPGRHRSPAYPALGLRDAIIRLRRVWDADKRAGSPVDAALRHMGFNSRNGASLKVLSAMKKFGLMEENSGRVILTQRAVEIVSFPPESERHVAALREAALFPGIYRTLAEQAVRRGSIPSDITLRAELQADMEFNPNAVEDFIKDFRDTLEYVSLADIDALQLALGGGDVITPLPNEVKEPDSLGASLVKELERGRTTGEALKSIGERWGAPLLTQAIVISIPRNMKVDVAVRGDEIKKEDLAKIKSQFNRWIEGLEEAFE